MKEKYFDDCEKFCESDLENYELDKEDAEEISLDLQKCFNLSSLRLLLDIEALIQRQVGYYISSGFKNIKNLQNVEIQVIGVIPDDTIIEPGLSVFLENCSHLSRLKIDAKKGRFGQESAFDFFSGLGKCVNLQVLEIHLDQGDKLADKGCQKLSLAIENMQNLTSLQLCLSNNQVGDEGCSRIAQAIQNLQNLKSLEFNLSLNEIGNEGCTKLGQAIGKCQNLTSLNLDLCKNQIEEKGAQDLGSALSQCANVSKLKLIFECSKFRNNYQESYQFVKFGT
ncbi:kinase domain protein (macronuclear) [Tetrahymena thermophila SB210]|uniref:Kinase domain protein n=1 Tax=Tetrahymena thermophila (strain SB210) TaxID=312017 RepID=Q22X61_TETTS|nr:kinase domain protein [Tetrahymena thermophila SB210]EAR89785.2 kinase domain protein [Tetrahymena thermophila SB210]|eukprot:XP_001010030.2 kinase domain protein [Tetrahymena thermophila SB210]